MKIFNATPARPATPYASICCCCGSIFLGDDSEEYNPGVCLIQNKPKVFAGADFLIEEIPLGDESIYLKFRIATVDQNV